MPATRRMGRNIVGGLRSLRGARAPASRSEGRREVEWRRRYGVAAGGSGDEEALAAQPRAFHTEAQHAAGPRSLLNAECAECDTDDLVPRPSSHGLGEAELDKIIRDRDEHWELQRAELGEAFDEEEVMTLYAKEQLLQANSNADVLARAEILIEEDWLGKTDALPGNIYRLAVMGDIFVKFEGRSLATNAAATAKILGVLLVVAVQLLGPPMIFLSKMFGIGVLDDKANKWHCCPWHPSFDPSSEDACFYRDTLPKDVGLFDDWHHIATTKALGILMMAAFILNGLFVILDEKSSWCQIFETFRHLDVANPNFRLSGRTFLFLDVFMNTWVISWCCVDIFFVIGVAEKPSDVLMNALALLFLYNLDDIGGDLGFVNDDDWPGLRLAWFYREVVHTEVRSDDTLAFSKSWALLRCVALTMYNATICLTTVSFVLIPALASATPFIQIINSND